MSNSLQLYEVATTHLDDALDALNHIFCQRCSYTANDPNAKPICGVHHKGSIHKYLQGAQPAMLDRFIRNNECNHGIFHGISTMMVSMLLLRKELPQLRQAVEQHYQNDEGQECAYYHSDRYNKHLPIEKMIASCLLHDFLRPNGYELSDHDYKLRQWYSNLMECTYSHSHPANIDNPFLQADIIELRRYPDYLDWYNPGAIEPHLSDGDNEVFGGYYNSIRQALEKVFHHRTEPFLRHGPEEKHDLSINVYPQNAEPVMAVEIDRAPFDNCFNHGETDSTINTFGIVRGLLPLSDFRMLDAQITADEYPSFIGQTMDCLCAKFNTKFDDWTFIINHNKNTDLYNHPWLLDFVKYLLDSGHKVVAQSTLKKFFKLANTIEDRMNFLSKK